MSSKSKLKFFLLAATAVIILNPALMPNILSAETQVLAQDMSQDMPDNNGLNDLLNDRATSEVSVDSTNQAFSLPTDTTSPFAAAVQVPINASVEPGDNPFIRKSNPQSSAASADVKSGPSVSSIASVPLVTPVSVGATPTIPVAVNPFKKTVPAGDATAMVDTQAKAANLVDINALRYYASTRDLKRVGAEMRRLKELYPDWQPPKDLFTQGSNVDEQPLWTIYATGNYAAVRSEIAKAQSINPKWQPSDDLLSKLQIAETRSLIASAYAQHRWQDVLSTAQALPSIMVCGEMQVQWNVAEAFAQMHNYADAFDVYRYILTSCDDHDLRLATVQKASLLIPPAGFGSLIALGRPTQDGHPEFEDIGFDGIRRQIGSFIEQGDFSNAPSNDEIIRFVDFVQRTGAAQDANLIGWYFYSQKEWQTANTWFMQAARFKRDPKSIEGIILTLRQMDKTDDALKLARRYLKASPDVAQQYIEIVAGSLTSEKSDVKLDEHDEATFESLVTEQKSALGAQALGWKYLAANDKSSAKTWFEDSVEWVPTEGGVVGLAVMAARSKNYATLSTLKATYGKDYAALQDFKIYRINKPRAKPIKQKRQPKTEPKTLADYFRSAT